MMIKKWFIFFSLLVIGPTFSHDHQQTTVSPEDISKFMEVVPNLCNKILLEVIKPSTTDKNSLLAYTTASTCCYIAALACANIMTQQSLGPTLEDYIAKGTAYSETGISYKAIEQRLALISEVQAELEKKTAIKAVYHITPSHPSSLNASAFKMLGTCHISLNKGWLLSRAYTSVTTYKNHLRAVLCHEIGHLWHNHTLKNNLYWGFKAFFINFLFYKLYSNYGNLKNKYLNPRTQDEWGQWSYTTKLTAPHDWSDQLDRARNKAEILPFVTSLATIPVSFFISRIFEFQADAFATRFVDAKHLRKALKLISPPRDLTAVGIFLKIFSTHPTTRNRLNRLKKPDIASKSVWIDPTCWKCW